MEAMLCDLEKSKVKADGLFLNADAGFDCDILRSMPERNDIIPNICISKQRKDTDDIMTDDVLYAERYSIERTNVWMDSYR